MAAQSKATVKASPRATTTMMIPESTSVLQATAQPQAASSMEQVEALSQHVAQCSNAHGHRQ